MARFALLKNPEPETPTPPVFPSLADVDPEYGNLVARRDELDRRRVELTAEHAVLYERCAGVGVAEWERDARARALVDGAGEQPETAPHHRCAELVREINDITNALAVLTRCIHDARQRASAKVCDLVAPEHSRRVRAICDALTALDSAFASYADFATAMNAQNVHWSTLRPMSTSVFGRPSTRGNLASAYLTRAHRAGFIDELPEWMRIDR